MNYQPVANLGESAFPRSSPFRASPLVPKLQLERARNMLPTMDHSIGGLPHRTDSFDHHHLGLVLHHQRRVPHTHQEAVPMTLLLLLGLLTPRRNIQDEAS